ncbi:glycine cleavage system protein GcvH [Aliikangiella coralliicola]|uniref:Glycine cleavage system H protein n=1 Tax=Aliikangiella coralliicola TaxID=2592383 RepID=A0A545UGV6_9GAMM|nr:glycine cleavage system protein GcvH [Aliikangiella coralliicola]TQV88707.1 glycine cleavage system protein GcvH [Aliikangiella coralliicola]
MSNVPNELKYISSHEWIRQEDDGTVTIGITDHAQELLGDVVYVELPDVDTDVATEDEIAVVESVKAASDIYAPLSGTIIAINEALEDAPETVNSSPYDDGWMFKMKPSEPSELDNLLDAEAYTNEIDE